MSLTGYQIGGALNTINQAQSNMPIGPALIGALGSIGSSLIGNRGRRRNEGRARKFNLKMWNLQNKYNHPLQQMARLQEAGLNPNMIYGSSPGSAVGNAGAVAPGKAPEYKMANPIPSAFDAHLKAGQVSNLSTQNVLNMANSTKALSEAGVKKEDLRRMLATFGEYVDVAKENARKSRYEADTSQIRRDIEKETQKDKVRKILADADLSEFKADLEEAISTRAKAGWLPKDTIGNLLYEYLGINKNTPDWKKETIALSPVVMGILKALPPHYRIMATKILTAGLSTKFINEYFEKLWTKQGWD
tara:strand:+ start:720 stop:1631 length:912 start_codon:yes stop_codon:yes gene_type:complete